MLGKQILNYEIKSLLGEGGMGNVYLGEHLSIGRKVAIKVLRPELSSKDEIRKRFKNEARVMAQLQHPGIVGLYDFHEDENGLYLIMEYVQGEELAQKIARLQEPMNIEEAKGIMIKVLEAFKYAHANGIIHRDVKPANILIDYSNNVKVLDFGIAKIVGSEQFNLTRDGSHVGTAYYMSPEQVKATELDKRSDIYSLGVNFYEMLAGFCPYKSLTSEYDIYTKIVQEPLTSLVETMGSDYNNVWEVISKATSKHPESRYQNCQEMIEDLKSDKTTMKSTITQHSGSENAQMSQSPISPKRSTNKGLRAGLIVAAVVITGLIAFIVMNGRENDVNTGAPEPDNQADVSN